MENLKPLSDFFAAIEKDFRISTTHIAIYAALLQLRIGKGFINPVEVFSRDIVSIAKISSTYTYIKCVQDLNDYGYINYVRSFKKTQASKIYFVDLQGS
ncbi:hypothetical protein [Flavobacterium nitrogenifigens]|uniref:Helix-turn-helix domain-containing protein n=1 Tax=Flavobacterium nitrogenifigens TaxID=1617283 RepID=A0A521B5U3_9FLAO|nr:hypothetical protein [Flavobacterium nitrogenifigens]KAF2334561.1 hypothetical protein DM397_07765 [Flavobacterium nitrogenifigens]SMO42435.1 hypothetical protein SAMN06265220_101686 [Flavobacterium nitrogenifigens]